ncbi:MAG TPA: hypothetical protein VLK58_01860 [Conexibacter sp.]|nr:hypothetical protein [Conexibacter sp.]
MSGKLLALVIVLGVLAAFLIGIFLASLGPDSFSPENSFVTVAFR